MSVMEIGQPKQTISDDAAWQSVETILLLVNGRHNDRAMAAALLRIAANILAPEPSGDRRRPLHDAEGAF